MKLLKRKTAFILAVTAALSMLCIAPVSAEEFGYLHAQYKQGFMPSGTPGKAVKIEFPVVEKTPSKITISNVQYSVDLGGSDSAFELGNFSKTIKPGVDGRYNISVSPKIRANAEDSYSKIVFNFTYDITDSSTGEITPGTQSIDVNVKVGRPDRPTPAPPTDEPITEPPTEPPVYQPHIILKAYEVPKSVVVGDVFKVSLTLENMSKEGDAKNVRVSLKSEDNSFLPTEGTGSQYFDSIPKGTSKAVEFEVAASEDIENKTNTLTMEVDCEDSAGTAVTLTEPFIITVKQKIRMDISKPKYSELVAEGESFPVTITVNNKGKGNINNVIAELISDTIMSDGKSYGNNLEPGATKDLELNCTVGGTGVTNDAEGGYGGFLNDAVPVPREDAIPSEGRLPNGLAVASLKNVALAPAVDEGMQADPENLISYTSEPTGESGAENSADPSVGEAEGLDTESGPGLTEESVMTGTVVLTYEDEYAKEYREEFEISVAVQPAPTYDPGAMTDDTEVEQPNPFPTWAWVSIAGAVIIGGVVAINIIRAKKRKAMFEADDLY